jgi:hypothetical protein
VPSPREPGPGAAQPSQTESAQDSGHYLGPVALPDQRRDELAVAVNRDGEITVEGVKAEEVIPGLIPRLAVRDLPAARCPIMHIFDLTHILRRGCRHQAGHGESVFVSVGIKGPGPSFAHDSNHGFRKRWDTTDTNESDITEASFCQ